MELAASETLLNEYEGLRQQEIAMQLDISNRQAELDKLREEFQVHSEKTAEARNRLLTAIDSKVGL